MIAGKKKGVSMILIALAIFALLAMAALAVDWGVVYFTRQRLQNFADASALAGAQELPNSANGKQKAAETYARNYGEYGESSPTPIPTPLPISCPSNDPDVQPTTTCYRIGNDMVHVTTPYRRSGDSSPNPNLINVKACRVVSLFFARVLGVTQIRVCAKATAIGRSPIPRGLVVLDPSGSSALYVDGSSRLLVPNGSIIVNSSANDALTVSGTASVLAQQISVVGNYRAVGTVSIIPTPLTGQSPAPDPLASLPPPPTTGLPTYPGQIITGTRTLYPGIYTGPIVVQATGKAILQPGIYVLRGGLLVTGSSSIEGSEVMLYNESGQIEISGSSTANLSPPTSGTYQGITIFQPATNTQPVVFSGSGPIKILGTVYTPRASVQLKGSVPMVVDMIVTWRLSVYGSSRLEIYAKEPPAAVGDVVSLVE